MPIGLVRGGFQRPRRLAARQWRYMYSAGSARSATATAEPRKAGKVALDNARGGVPARPGGIPARAVRAPVRARVNVRVLSAQCCLRRVRHRGGGVLRKYRHRRNSPGLPRDQFPRPWLFSTAEARLELMDSAGFWVGMGLSLPTRADYDAS